MTPPDLVTADQAAAIVGCSRRTINRWADAGRLIEAMKLPGISGARLFRRADVEALVGEQAS